MTGRVRLLVAVATFLAFVVAPGAGERAAAAPSVQGVRCLADARIDLLGGLFDSEPAGVVGADYQRATDLGDGRVLWTFQDAAIRLGPDEITIVHNIAALQDGACFSILYGGSRSEPEPFFFGDITQPYQRWYWPLGAAPANDGKVYVFVAEMEERGDDYLTHAVPVRTHVVALDGRTLLPVGRSPAPDSSAALYGWSVTSDRDWTYLYAQCHRQFGFGEVDGIAAHDPCATRVTVGRVPRGQLLAAPEYWNGSMWQGDPALAAPIVPTAGRIAHATQIVWTGASFVSIDKLDDWWGDTIVFGRSSTAAGPFVEFDRVTEPLKCAAFECNTFFASWVPWAAAERPARTLGWTISHNRWDGEISAMYRPSFHTVAAPQFMPPRTTFSVAVPSGGGVPVLNVTAVAPSGAGHVTVFPCDREVPTASNVNYRAGETVANLVMVRPDASGNVCVYSHAEVDLVVDLAGRASSYAAVDNPVRLVDTRVGVGGPVGRVSAGGVFSVAVPSGGGVPVLNVTAVAPSGAGHVTVFPCDREVPTASNVNYRAGETVANLVMVRPDASGNVCVYSHAEVDLVVDHTGTWTSDVVPVDNPTRVTDTRLLP